MPAKKDNPRVHQVRVYFTEEEVRAIKAEAERRDRTESYVVRSAWLLQSGARRALSEGMSA